MVRKTVVANSIEDLRARENDPPEGLLSDRQWEYLASRLPDLIGKKSANQLVTRRFIEAVLWIATTGAGWAELPKGYGNFHTAYCRFLRWTRLNLWDFVCTCLEDDPRFHAIARMVATHRQMLERRASYKPPAPGE